MEPTGAAIGLIEQTVFEQRSIAMEIGDRILMYTDGVVESFDRQKKMFGQERLEEYLRVSSQKSAQQIIAGLKEVLQKFSGVSTPADDTTMIAMRVVS